MKIFVFAILLMSSVVHAQDAYFEMRVSWVKSMKELLAEIEAKESHLLLVEEKRFLETFQIMNEAWADSRYNCFYAGWPSVKKGKYCQNPMRMNSSYDKGACKSDELQCQPLLFGKGLCVSFKTQAERNKTFANCETKFQKEHNGSYDFLKNPTRKETEDLREISHLAGEICQKNNSGICKKILQKFPDAMKSLDEAHTQAVTSVPVQEVKTTPDVKTDNGEDCTDPTHAHEDLAKTVTKLADKSLDDLYEDMKKEFQSSPMCDPLKIINDPTDRPSGFQLARLQKDIGIIDFIGNSSGPKDAHYDKIASTHKLSPSLRDELLPIMNSLPKSGAATEEERRNKANKIKGLILQDYLANYKKEDADVELVKSDLVKHHIFTKNDDGQIECPFVTKDAFMKAMKGREAVLKKHPGSIKNKDQITIVDYTRPSNERRMFVMDLKSNKVLHNTWVAHGGGGGNLEGKDGLGGSPEMSNVPGSRKSSDGFIIATQKAHGTLYGPNVLLRGIDQNNDKLASRAVVLHAWGSPMHSYSAGVDEYDSDTGKFSHTYDAIDLIKKTDFRTASTKETSKSLYGVTSATGVASMLGATEGCLGVPVINVKHLDRKGRDKSQLELLRDDLPGSVIFNYSGPDMQSKYF